MVDTPKKGDGIQYNVGVDDLLIVFKTTKETSATEPVYDPTVYRLPNIKKIGVKGNGKAAEIYGSSKLFAKVVQETQHELSLTHIGMPINIYDKMTGNDIKKGVAFSKTAAHEFPEFAAGIIANRSDGVKDVVWYPNCSLDPATASDYETAEEAFKEQDGSLTITANGLRNSGIIYSHFNSAREIVEGLDFETFIAQPVFSESQLDGLVNTKKVTGVTLNKTTLSLKVGASETLIPTVAPADAADKTGAWTIDKPEFATVVDGKVTAVAAGVAKATFTTTDGSFTATCTVTVTAA